MAWRQGLPYGQDLRDRVLASRDAGQSVRAVAERFSVRWGNGPATGLGGESGRPSGWWRRQTGDDHGALCRD